MALLALTLSLHGVDATFTLYLVDCRLLVGVAFPVWLLIIKLKSGKRLWLRYVIARRCQQTVVHSLSRYGLCLAWAFRRNGYPEAALEITL